LYSFIRRDRRVEPGLSQRALARRYGVGRRTVRLALASATPPPREKPVTAREPVLCPAAGWIDEMLRADLSAPRKQRHTIVRVHQRLREEHGFDGASYSTVRNYVNRRRPEIAEEAGRGRHQPQGVVPQVHAPGAEAEVDFCDVWVRLAGEPVKCHLFTLRLSYSGKAVHRVYASQSQEAFMEGHVEAFAVLGGVPTRHIRYDNLKPAVQQVCFGRTRVESQRWVAFRSHYGFDAFYCLPGVEGAHEKGGVEHEGGRFRRAHLVPVPEVATLAELNARLAALDMAEDDRHITGEADPVGVNFAAEAGLLAPLPGEDFDCGLTLAPLVRRDSRVVVRQCFYSAPARLIGRRVRVSLRAGEVWVFDGADVVARHPRLARRHAYHDDLDHFLEILLVKPGALAGSTALAQAREEGAFTAAHEALWSAARAAHGDAAGTRVLIEVLLLHRRMPAGAVEAGIRAALGAGSTSPALVAIEARKAGGAAGPGPGEAGTGDAGPPAPGRTLPGDTRPLPSVAAYDALLSRTRVGAA
jgi:transposase